MALYSVCLEGLDGIIETLIHIFTVRPCYIDKLWEYIKPDGTTTHIER